MDSKRDLFSAVARRALPRGNRKLRANPSFTRTTSPIWPSLPMRSSRITSIVVTPQLNPNLHWWLSSGQAGRSPLARHTRTQIDRRFDEAEHTNREHRPAEHEHRGVNATQHQQASVHAPRDNVQDRYAEHTVGHQQTC